MGPADAESRRKTLGWHAPPEGTPQPQSASATPPTGMRWMPETGELPAFPSTPAPKPTVAPTVIPVTAPVPDLGRHAGEQIGGRYNLVRELGSGALTETWEAVHIELGRHVAIKFLRQQAAGMAEEMLEVARNVAQIRHPHVVEYSDFGRLPTGDPYFVMELLSGSTVARVLARRGVIPWARAVNIAQQICGALSAAHERGVIHRDIRPGNIFMIDRTGATSDFVKVVDFGLARGTRIGGTPGFMSPEQCRHEQLDPRSDVYAMGCLLYAMSTGEPPFGRTGENLYWRQINEAPKPLRDFGARQFIPDELEVVVARCLEKQPARRFATPAELAGALADLANFAAATSVVHGRIVDGGSSSTPMKFAGRKASVSEASGSEGSSSVTAAKPQAAPAQGFTAEAVAAIVVGAVLFVGSVGVGVWWLVSRMLEQPAAAQVTEPAEGDAGSPSTAASAAPEVASEAASDEQPVAAPAAEPSEDAVVEPGPSEVAVEPEAAPSEPAPKRGAAKRPAEDASPAEAESEAKAEPSKPKPSEPVEPKPTKSESMANENIGHEDLVDPWN